MSDATGKFVWYDLMTTDLAAARSFYTDVVGWSQVPMEGTAEYMMWGTPTGPVGGSMQLPPEAAAMGAPPHWLAYVAATDVDAVCAKATERGGTILRAPWTVPGVGRLAILRDPAGAVFAAITMDDMSDAADTPVAPGHGSWCEVYTDDQAAIFEFYSALFGWVKTSAMEMPGGAVYQMYGRPGGRPLGGMMNRPPMIPASCWAFYFHVQGLDAAAERVKAGGGSVMHGPMEVPGGDRVAVCMDPQGAMFALHESSPATSMPS